MVGKGGWWSELASLCNTAVAGISCPNRVQVLAVWSSVDNFITKGYATSALLSAGATHATGGGRIRCFKSTYPIRPLVADVNLVPPLPLKDVLAYSWQSHESAPIYEEYPGQI